MSVMPRIMEIVKNCENFGKKEGNKERKILDNYGESNYKNSRNSGKLR